ncbi:MAG TPA: flagellar export chaperone FliS [Bryobacteraceae bacterium]
MATNAQNTYLESRILSAGGIELVQILYEAAMEAVESARKHLNQGDIAARSKAITKAYAILTELSAALDQSAGGEFSRTLFELYTYMGGQLLKANMEQSEPPLIEVSKLLATLLEGWMSCTASVPGAIEEPAPVAAPRPRYGYRSAPGTEDDSTEECLRGSMVAVSC